MKNNKIKNVPVHINKHNKKIKNKNSIKKTTILNTVKTTKEATVIQKGKIQILKKPLIVKPPQIIKKPVQIIQKPQFNLKKQNINRKPVVQKPQVIQKPVVQKPQIIQKPVVQKQEDIKIPAMNLKRLAQFKK